MKTNRLRLAVLIIGASFLLMNIGERINPSVRARSGNSFNPEVQGKAAFPSFLEKGKTYNFSFAFSTGEYSSSATFPVTIIGKVERIEADSGWVYINHYVTKRKGKAFESKFEGYSWININQVYQCSEMTLNP